MFTVFAILLTVFGVPLFARGGLNRKQHSLANNVGGLMLIIAFILWCVVVVSLLAQFATWLWENAP